jgi:hypothetical protein
MTQKESFFVFIVGLLFTGFGVGGVENSITNQDLLVSTLVALVGLAVMYCGTLAIKNSVDQ